MTNLKAESERLVALLQRAWTTAQNDDVSARNTPARLRHLGRQNANDEAVEHIAALQAEVDRLGKVLLVLDASMDGHSMSAEGMYLLHAETRHHDTGDLCIGSIRAIDATIAAKSQP